MVLRFQQRKKAEPSEHDFRSEQTRFRDKSRNGHVRAVLLSRGDARLLYVFQNDHVFRAYGSNLLNLAGPTAKDDLYALCMVALWLLRGADQLPWNDECGKEAARLEWITVTKETMRGSELFQGCPSAFCDFYEYVRNIPGGAIPDYAFWIQRFHEERKVYPVKKGVARQQQKFSNGTDKGLQ